MPFVFIADNRSMPEDRKELPLILGAEWAVLLCKVWSVCAQRENKQVAGRTDACLHASVSGCATDVHSIVAKL